MPNKCIIKGEMVNNIFSIIEPKVKSKFTEDAISFESNDFYITVPKGGYFLNVKECLERFSCNGMTDLIKKVYSLGIPLSQVLNGAYVISIFDKKLNRLCVYNDLLSKRSLYYYYDNNSKHLLFSDSFFNTLQMVIEHKLPYTIDELGVKMMLWHRMFYDNLTYIREIKFLRPFEYLSVEDGCLKVESIKRPEMIDVSLDEAASHIHKLFDKAVKLQYEKNEINGYPQVTTLSGGMDSRSTFLYGIANGYNNQTCYCYGESTSVDFEYAKQLAIKNHCNFFFHAIDNGDFLCMRDELCEANEGQMVYSGPTGTYDSLNFYNTDKVGIIHTGLGGGEIMGDMRVAENPDKLEGFIESLKYRFGKGKKDRSWDSFIRSLRCNDEDLKRIEEFKTYYRDFNEFQSLNDVRRCLNAQKNAQSFGVEYVSPFLYEEFFCYMLRIPYSLTKGRKLYVYWQKKYNSKQFETPSTFMLGCKPGNIIGYYIKLVWQRLMNKYGKKTNLDMNPYEYWLSHNPKISSALAEMFEKDMGIIKNQIEPEINSLLQNAWDMKMIPHQNILTASWALTKILNK